MKKQNTMEANITEVIERNNIKNEMDIRELKMHIRKIFSIKQSINERCKRMPLSQLQQNMLAETDRTLNDGIASLIMLYSNERTHLVPVMDKSRIGGFKVITEDTRDIIEDMKILGLRHSNDD